MTTDEVNVKLTADGSQFEREIVNAGKKAKDFGDTVEKSTDKASDGFEKLKSTITGLGLVAGLKKTLNLAGELEQNLGGAKAVFGSYAKDMQDMAAQAYSKLGLSQSEYLVTANKMGALFKGSGFSAAQSADMTTAAMQRAADVASIMGLDIGSAMESVAGAAKGNFTMMDNLGVAINDTTLKLYAQEHGLGKLETTQQKVNAAMQMFLDKTEYAAGNYTKENDTFAGAFQTAKAEVLNLVAAVGTELLPAATTIIPIVTDVIREVSPVVEDVANGISWVAQGLKGLDNPMGKTILYVGLATAVLNKMKFALGGTATGFILLGTLLSWVIGRLNDTEQAEAEVVEASMDGAAAAADKASESVDGLTDNIEEAGKAANRLAGFDEITKLSGSGSGTIASKIASDEDISRIEKYNRFLEDFYKKQKMASKMGAFDFSEFEKGWNEFWDLISKGNIEGAFNLVADTIDTALTKIFGESYTNIKNYWNDVLALAQDEGIGAAIEKVAGDIDTVLTEIFGDGYTKIKEYLSDIFTAYSQFMQKIGSGLYELFNKGEIDDNKLRDKYSGTYTELMDAVILNLKDGMGAKEALNDAKADILTTPEAVYWYNNVLKSENVLTAFEVEEWRKNLIESGQLAENASTNEFAQYEAGEPPLTASQMESLISMAGLAGNVAGYTPTGVVPTAIIAKIFLDSEEVYNKKVTDTTNGMY